MSDLSESRVVQEHPLTCEILVAGGGIAGVSAAITAARLGRKVILCQDRPVLGGNASSEVRMHIVGADGSGQRGVPLQTEAREGGLIEEIRLEAAIRNPQRSSSMFDLILYEKCRAEPNLTLLLNATLTRAFLEGREIQSVWVERPSTEERFRIAADVFIDCTGDGRLGVEAGARFREGREAQAEFQETLAQPDADHCRLGSSIMFQARWHPQPMPFMPPDWARKFTEEDLKLRPHAVADLDRGLEYGYWWIEWGGRLDTIRDNETIRDELLSIVMGAWDHVKNGGDHGADHWALEWFGFLPGKRESRRFVGLQTFTEQDILEARPCDDAIAYGGWPIDTHPPEGVDAPDLPPCVQHPVPYLYEIPLKICLSRDIPNLMFAGRNLSATHIAFASTRVMATCAAIGQGVGTAAAQAIKEHCLPAELPERPDSLQMIQQQLLRDDAFLISRKNQDANDLARQAQITASSQQPGGEASCVIDGYTRSVHGPRGARPERAETGTHRWMSSPEQGLPAWLILHWKQPIQAKSLQLVFDTGLHRVLTFSLADAYTAKMHWGAPQPETVADFQVECACKGLWRVVAQVQGNYQRLRRIRLDGSPFDQLKLTVLATHGLDHARICEVRIYAEELERLTKL